MRNDQKAHFSTTNLRNTLACQFDRIGIEPGVCFIQDGEPGLQHGQLKNFGPFHFTP